MSVVRKTVSFTASEVKPNLLTGLTEEFLTRPSALKLYASQLVAGEVLLDLQVGNVSIAKDLEAGVKAPGVLVRNEDLIASTVGSPGDRIQIRARETSGTTSGLTFMLEIAELA
jgi:hypothetical protein